jgi:2'-5' RNA ligase
MTIISVNLIFDEHSEQEIKELWKTLFSEGVLSSLAEKYRPHITIAAYESANPSALSDIVSRIGERIKPAKISLSPIGCFPENGVLFLAPRVSRWLLDLHQFSLDLIYSRISANLVYDYLVKDRWVPHVTLAKSMDERSLVQGFRVALLHWRPIEVNGIALTVRVHPSLADFSVHRFSEV